MPINANHAGLEAYVIEQRRWHHAHPETGFDVQGTHDHILCELEKLHLEAIPHVGRNSLIGIIRNGEGPVLGLRADIDALPLQEENDFPYRSQIDGRMHACGHDAHTAMLLGAAKYLSENRDSWQGTVKLIFQEAEEGPHPGGAKGVVDSGLLDDVEAFYALHVSPEYPTGTFAMKPGAAFASVCTFKITLFGKGCHAASPHQGLDPIVMQAEVVDMFHKIVSRKLSPLEPAVISITQVHGGTTHNIIPESVYLEGTVRVFAKETKSKIKSEMDAILTAVATRHGGNYEFAYIEEYDTVTNTPDAVAYFQSVAAALFGPEAFRILDKPSMGGEDFFRYVNLSNRGCIAWIGTRKDEATARSLHNPHFAIDESALIKGVSVLVELIKNYQRSV